MASDSLEHFSMDCTSGRSAMVFTSAVSTTQLLFYFVCLFKPVYDVVPAGPNTLGS